MRLSCVLLLCLGASTVSAASMLFPLRPRWTKLTLTHHWPKTFCDMQKCHSSINYWTLHGLWPNLGNACNSSWAFNSSLIEDIRPDMDKSWPDLFKPKSTQFWKYEWNKHGTCAAQIEDLNSQHKYFSKALELYHKLDLNSVLKKFNITPSAEYYSFAAIESAIEGLYGVKPKIQCDHHSKVTDAQALGQIEICFHSDFTLIDCGKNSVGGDRLRAARVSEYSVCDHDVPVYYPPLS